MSLPNLNLVHNKPWWWFMTGRKWGEVAMTFGDKVYVKEDQARPDVLVHESVHVRQCKGKWYISLWFLIRSTFDDKFYRDLEEEAEVEQMNYVYENNRDNGLWTK